MEEQFKPIPGYSSYGVTRDGRIKSLVRNIELPQYLLDGYCIVDAFYDSLTQTLPVHRAVALAWVNNPDPEHLIIVNHKDGNRTNNVADNLEWSSYSGNNYHAVENGLRNDNLVCKVRDFETGEVRTFASITQANEFMGLAKTTPVALLLFKQFGRLLADRYEFKFMDDPAPWFYENRVGLVKPSRFRVEIVESDGSKAEIYSTKSFLKAYQLYDSPYGRSMPALTRYANEKFPEREFILHDSYHMVKYRPRRNTRKSFIMSVEAIKEGQRLTFRSLSDCARHFNVDRSSITARLGNDKDLDGWTFTS